MQERVQWKHPLIVEHNIDQTRLVLDNQLEDHEKFSFMVMGDSGAGAHLTHNPQREIALAIFDNLDDCSFILHTGDLVYQLGSKEYYHKNFIKPYQEIIQGSPDTISYDQLTFKIPFLPVLGNHDYYDLPWLSALVVQGSTPLRMLMGLPVDLNVGWEGSNQGDVFARAFVDYLKQFRNNDHLLNHLHSHYTSQTETGRALSYQPGLFTRLPNRYYQFTYGGIDFFALDSNTFNSPLPLATDSGGDKERQILRQKITQIEQEELELLEHPQQLEELEAELEQLEEIKLDIDKQLTATDNPTIDIEQLEWLKQRLIDSWSNPKIRGRVIYFHHPPYVTEVNKRDQAQTLAVRRNLRWVLDRVAEGIGKTNQERPIVDLVLSGHAHCLEYIQTENTGHADSYTNWLICGGSGYSLRRQSPQGDELSEPDKGVIARSNLFLGYSGFASSARRPYSAVRIEVSDGCSPKFLVRPIVRERFQQQWGDRHVEPFTIIS